MHGLGASRQEGDDLYERIGAFLADHGLSADPAHYSFAFDVMSRPEGVLAQAVARLTDGGIRLSRRDIETLGGSVKLGGAAVDRASEDDAAQLVAETQAQVDDFATTMRKIQDETRGFGRDLAQSAAAIERAPRDAAGLAGIDEIARITGAMLGRIHDAEARLAQATSETDALRTKLAEANDTARRDVLTGLPNRRAFDEAFAARDTATGPFCLALCDIDRFKRINDEHGHGVGDRVLSAIAGTLAEECGGHLVVRHGGEEFAILLHGVNLVDAARELDRVRSIIATKRFRNRETDRSLGEVTVSMGITAVHHDESSADAFARADRLLYTAKADGRDRVCAA